MKNKLEVFFLFILVCFFSLGNIENLCKIYSPLHFDNQALLTWNYTALIGMLPYKDIFYPYGLLNYFKNQHIIFSLIYFFITPFIFTVIFVYFRNLFKGKIFSYVSFFFLFTFILFITGFETFSRYGVLVALAVLFSLLFFYRTKHFYKLLFFMGIGVGVVFSLINDQGVYGFILFFVYAVFDKVLKKIWKREGVYATLREIGIFILGFVIGVLPFFFYLVYHDALIPFISYLKTIPELSLYAKTPFFHAFINLNNVFTVGILFAALFWLPYKILFTHQKVQLNTYAQIGLVFILILLEQKNIIRLMDMQLTFIAFLLFISLFYDLQHMFQKKFGQQKQVVLYTSALCLFFLLLEQNANVSLQLPSVQNTLKTIQIRSCVAYNLLHTPNIYTKIKNEITKDTKFNGKIFSFPSDPLFYSVFNQKPPHYPNAYDGSALHAQQDTISYIEKNNIQYVIINTKIKKIQDEVPDYVRTPYVFSYIMNNFKPYTSMNGYLILKKDYKKDFFLTNILEKEYKHFLLTVDLENIPRSEGYHKKNYLSGNTVIVEGQSLAIVNNYLKKNIVESERKFLLLEFKNSTLKEHVFFVMRSTGGLSTQVSLKQCEVGIPCIINISRLPLFYKTRRLQEITGIEESYISRIKLLDIVNASRFW